MNRKEVIDILVKYGKYISDNCTDTYGHLQMEDIADGEFYTESYIGAANNFYDQVLNPRNGRISVIHPSDESTDFLCDSYLNLDVDVIHDKLTSKDLIGALGTYSTIFFMGHGTEYGLSGTSSFVTVGSEFVDLMRDVRCIYIWCNANLFVEKYSLPSPLYTGMIISDINEAYLYGINCSIEDLNISNLRFARAIRHGMMRPDPDVVKTEYWMAGNPIIEFNINNIYGKK